MIVGREEEVKWFSIGREVERNLKDAGLSRGCEGC